MKVAKIVSTVLAIFVTLPIWFFLLYRILVATDASELSWFLYWIYVPASLIVGVLVQVIKSSDE